MSDIKFANIFGDGSLQFMKPDPAPEDITKLVYDKMRAAEINVSLIENPVISMEANDKTIALEVKTYFMNDIDHGVKALQIQWPSQVLLLEAKREYQNGVEKTKVRMIIISFRTQGVQYDLTLTPIMHKRK